LYEWPSALNLGVASVACLLRDRGTPDGLWVLQRRLRALLGRHLMILLIYCRTIMPMEDKQKPIPWQQLERSVRTVAEAKFGATARAEDIAGVSRGKV
jgi:hypothetical protein